MEKKSRRQKEEERVAAILAKREAEARVKAAERAERESEPALVAQRFRESVPGRAAAAYDRGDAFFQVELSHADVTGSTNAFTGIARDATIGRRAVASDVLGRIEQAGWRLEHVNWIYVQTGQDSRNKFMGTGQQVVVTGQVVGIYLFRRDDEHGQTIERPDLATAKA